MIKRFALVSCFVMFLAGFAYAEHPLITDDADTQEKGAFKVEVNADFSFDREKINKTTVKTNENELGVILAYGVAENFELAVEAPYLWSRVKAAGETETEDGPGDVTIEGKWRFFNKHDTMLTLKPSITLPTGDEKRDLGNGKVGWGFAVIASHEYDSIKAAIHLNLGFMHNAYKLEEAKDAYRKDIWHVSLAGEKEVAKHLKLVANIGMERNPDIDSSNHPAFILGGFIYEATDHLKIGFGVKAGLTKPEPDWAVRPGVIYEF